MLQAEDRAHRIGQRSSVLVQHLIINGTLDAKIVKLIVAKLEMTRDALDSLVGNGK